MTDIELYAAIRAELKRRFDGGESPATFEELICALPWNKSGTEASDAYRRAKLRGALANLLHRGDIMRSKAGQATYAFNPDRDATGDLFDREEA